MLRAMRVSTIFAAIAAFSMMEAGAMVEQISFSNDTVGVGKCRRA